MKRTGSDYADVWKDESVFNVWREEALMRSESCLDIVISDPGSSLR
jgi:hypothetical protein